MVCGWRCHPSGHLIVELPKLWRQRRLLLHSRRSRPEGSEIQFNTIKVGGMVKTGSVDWDPENLKLSFILSNLKGIDIRVNHSGTPPDMFKENQGVVVEGKLDNAEASSMTSKKLMVKHSEEYKIPEAHQKSQEKELLEKSIFKDEK